MSSDSQADDTTFVAYWLRPHEPRTDHVQKPHAQVTVNEEGASLDDLDEGIAIIAGFLRRSKSEVLERLIGDEKTSGMDFAKTLMSRYVEQREESSIGLLSPIASRETGMRDGLESVRGTPIGTMTAALDVIQSSIPFRDSLSLADSLAKDDDVAFRWMRDIIEGRRTEKHEAVYEVVPFHVPSGPPPTLSDWMLDDISPDRCPTMSRYLGSADSWEGALRAVSRADSGGGKTSERPLSIAFRGDLNRVGLDGPSHDTFYMVRSPKTKALLEAWSELPEVARESALHVTHAIHHAAMRPSDNADEMAARTLRAGCEMMGQVVPKVHPSVVQLAMHVGQEAWPWKSIDPCFSELEMENIDNLVDEMAAKMQIREPSVPWITQSAADETDVQMKKEGIER